MCFVQRTFVSFDSHTLYNFYFCRISLSQGSTNYSILPSWTGEHGVSWDSMILGWENIKRNEEPWFEH